MACFYFAWPRFLPASLEDSASYWPLWAFTELCRTPVSQRTHEIGIRMALGAQRGQILSLIGRQGLWVVAAGLGIGMLLAFGVGELIQDFLVGIGPADAITYTTISILLAAVAMVACLVPARRAVQVDPMLALRNE